MTDESAVYGAGGAPVPGSTGTAPDPPTDAVRPPIAPRTASRKLFSVMFRSVPTPKFVASFALVFSRTSVALSMAEPATAFPAMFAPLASVPSTRPFERSPRVKVVLATLLNAPPDSAAIGAPTVAAHSDALFSSA